MSKGNALKGDRATRSMAVPAFHASDCEDGTYTHHKNPGDPGASALSYFTGTFSDPPTGDEIDAIIGLASEVDAGYTAILSDGIDDEYIVWSNGTYWFYAPGYPAYSSSP